MWENLSSISPWRSPAMRTILLTNKLCAQVDDEDYERVVQAGNWYADQHHGDRTYATRKVYGSTIYMHNFILGRSKLDTDHVDGDGLNNQRANLRRVTRSENNLNNHNIRSDNKSGCRGVYYEMHHRCWKAEMKVKGKKYHLGSFLSQQEACAARRVAEARYKQGLSPK